MSYQSYPSFGYSYGTGNFSNSLNTNGLNTNGLNTNGINANDTTKSENYSFKDIIVNPVLSCIKSRNEVSYVSRFSKTITLYNPYVVLSNDIDEVIKTNIGGGIGIINKMNIDDQVFNIKKIKDYMKLIDGSPITIYSTTSYSDILELFTRDNLDYVFVLNTNSYCIGMINKCTIDILKLRNYNGGCAFDIMIHIDNMKYFKLSDCDWKNIVTYTPWNIRDLLDEFRTNQIIPILGDNKKLLGVITLENLLKFYKYKSNCLVDEFGQLLAAGCIGVCQNYLEKVDKLVNAGLNILYINIENAYNNIVQTMITDIKLKHPNLVIIAGNVQCINGYKYLCDTGVDSIVVGCGEDIRQFSLLQECYNLQKMYNYPPIISWSGPSQQKGDHFKAILAGSNCLLVDRTSDNSNLEDQLKSIKNSMISVNAKTIDELMSPPQALYFIK